MSYSTQQQPTLFVLTEKPDETANWLEPLRGPFTPIVSATAEGAWAFLQGETVCAVVVELLSPRTHAPRAVTALKGRRELRNVPIYVLMSDEDMGQSTMAGVEGLHLVPESSAALDLPAMLLRDAREGSGVRPSLRQMPTGKLADSLKRALPRRPVGGLHKAASRNQSSGGSVSSDSAVDTTTKLATSSGDRS